MEQTGFLLAARGTVGPVCSSPRVVMWAALTLILSKVNYLPIMRPRNPDRSSAVQWSAPPGLGTPGGRVPVSRKQTRPLRLSLVSSAGAPHLAGRGQAAVLVRTF